MTYVAFITDDFDILFLLTKRNLDIYNNIYNNFYSFFIKTNIKNHLYNTYWIFKYIFVKCIFIYIFFFQLLISYYYYYVIIITFDIFLKYSIIFKYIIYIKKIFTFYVLRSTCFDIFDLPNCKIFLLILDSIIEIIMRCIMFF